MRLGSPAIIVIVTACFVGGCAEQQPQKPPYMISNTQGHERWESVMREMTDSAMLRNMSFADIHFEPHRAELNALGMRRVDRYADLLADHGGTILIESSATDQDINMARINVVLGELTDAGIANDRLQVAMGVNRGRGIAAIEAIGVKERSFSPESTGLTDLISGGTGGQLGTN